MVNEFPIVDGCVRFVISAIKLAKKDAANGDQEAAEFLEVLQTVAKPRLAPKRTQAPQSNARQQRRTT